MADRLSIGNVEVLCLTDANATLPLPLTALFVDTTEADWQPFKEASPELFSAEGFPHVHVGCYLVRSAGRTILVDTGLGPKPIELFGGASGNLPAEFVRKQVDPDSIDTVLTTHMHFDHVGANMGEDGTPRFKNARYLAGKADWDFFQIPEVQANFPPGSFSGPVEPLKAAGVLDLVEGDQVLTPEVTAIATPGHTPGHMSVLISSGGEKAIITGDTLASPAHVTHPEWAFMFDADQGQAVATRTALVERAEAEGLTLVACHLPAPGFGTVVRVEGKRYWRGI